MAAKVSPPILLALAVTAAISAQSIDDMEIEAERPCTIRTCREHCRNVPTTHQVDCDPNSKGFHKQPVVAERGEESRVHCERHAHAQLDGPQIEFFDHVLPHFLVDHVKMSRRAGIWDAAMTCKTVICSITAARRWRACR